MNVETAGVMFGANDTSSFLDTLHNVHIDVPGQGIVKGNRDGALKVRYCDK